VPTTTTQDKNPVVSDKRGGGKDRKGNRSLLDAYHPERYSRPDFNLWQAHTPTADAVPAPPVSAAAQAIQPPSGPAASASAPVSNQPPPAGPMSQMDLDPPVSQSRWKQGAQGSLPEAVAYFLSQLPPPEAFEGKMLPKRKGVLFMFNKLTYTIYRSYH
jgi:hypothetical protein